MFEFLFGAEMPGALRVVFTLIFIIGLIVAIMWAVRRFGSDRLGGSALRGRQPRLALVDQAAVDGRRRLVIIRRDNVEHLLMIGGPTDVVVETNIVRTAGASREAPVVRATLSDTLTRPVPFDEGAMWPLQPQPDFTARGPRADEPTQWTAQANLEMSPRPRRHDTLAGLADELSSRTAPPPTPRPTETPRPAVAPSQPARSTNPADQNLADMAQRLEAALRKPPEPRASDTSAKAEPAPATAPRPAPSAAEPKRPEAKPAQPKSQYDSLEQEMANLLGRPPGKT